MVMKKILMLSIAVLTLSFSFATSKVIPKPALKASEIFIPIGSSGSVISLLDLSRMSIKDAQAITGKKMSLIDKMGFKAAQRQLKKNINPDGTLNSKKFEKNLKPDVTSGFHLGGFALGFFLTIIGVLIAYLINDEKKPARVKWAWIGFGVSLVIWLVVGIL
jgi:hypothetical protein